ncbi:MAG: hypothetical protein IJD90_04825 [Clostridia bacterium]|nr:hypothetical protein [Clostridia bacterium]
MKRIKCFICLFLLTLMISTSTLAKSSKISIEFFEEKENTIELSLNSDYLYFTADDIDKSADFFKNMPVDKNEVINQINEGTYLNAFSEKKGSQVVLKITTDNFSQAITNFTPMDENDKKSVIKNFKNSFEQSGHSFLTEPDIVRIDGYDFIRFNCRYGSGEKGFSYKSVLTIIGGNCFELVRYNKISLPDDTANEEFDDIIDSLKLNIKGEKAQIAKSYFISVLTIAGIIVVMIIMISMIYSLIREYIVYKNHNEKVRLRKK